MGCKFSKGKKSPSNYIRVVHMDGHVEDFDYSLTAGEVTGILRKQFLCTQAQLMSGGLKPLKSDTWLEPSQIYFVISYSTLKSESSPLDVAITAKRLIKLAKTCKPQAKTPSSSGSSTRSTSTSGSESPIRSPKQFGDRSSAVEVGKGSGSWKPELDTIRESSFALRCESDLQEIQMKVII